MFIDISTEKILRLGMIIGLIVFGVYSTLLLDKSYFVGSRAKMTLNSLKSNVVYSGDKIASNGFGRSEPMNSATVFDALSSKDNPLLQGGTVWSRQDVSPQNAVSVPVLVYHGIPDEGDGNVDQTRFVNHMKALKKDGWQTVKLDDFYAFMKGEKDLPDKSFLLTFDDGRKDSFYPVDPVLKDLGYSAVMFVITGDSIDKNRDVPSTYYLSENELREMQKTGRWELEAHSRFAHRLYAISEDGQEGYFLGNKLWLGILGRQETDEEYTKRVKEDLLASREDMEVAFNKSVIAFAYPFSEYGQHSVNFPEAKNILQDMIPKIFKMAFFQVNKGENESFNYKGDYNRPLGWMIKRIEPNNDWTSDRLIEEFNSGKAKSLPYYDNLFSKEWLSSWGTMNIDNGLNLRASSQSTGASAYLNGTSAWKNYSVAATAIWEGNTHFMLTARHVDSKTYLICDFSKERVSLRTKIAGKGESIASGKIDPVDATKGMEVKMKVQDNVASCSIDGKKIIVSQVPAQLDKGGMGLEIWNEVIGEAAGTIKEVSVTQI